MAKRAERRDTSNQHLYIRPPLLHLRKRIFAELRAIHGTSGKHLIQILQRLDASHPAHDPEHAEAYIPRTTPHTTEGVRIAQPNGIRYRLPQDEVPLVVIPDLCLVSNPHATYSKTRATRLPKG